MLRWAAKQPHTHVHRYVRGTDLRALYLAPLTHGPCLHPQPTPQLVFILASPSHTSFVTQAPPQPLLSARCSLPTAGLQRCLVPPQHPAWPWRAVGGGRTWPRPPCSLFPPSTGRFVTVGPPPVSMETWESTTAQHWHFGSIDGKFYQLQLLRRQKGQESPGDALLRASLPAKGRGAPAA